MLELGPRKQLLLSGNNCCCNFDGKEGGDYESGKQTRGKAVIEEENKAPEPGREEWGTYMYMSSRIRRTNKLRPQVLHPEHHAKMTPCKVDYFNSQVCSVRVVFVHRGGCQAPRFQRDCQAPLQGSCSRDDAQSHRHLLLRNSGILALFRACIQSY